ncbi:MAG: response regulator transcription factor [Streptosporangiaceae bacterium]|nr:response regulator transcription factor [Streptosporangiaceae bacterium]
MSGHEQHSGDPVEGTAAPVRVLVVDDQQLIREGIASLLSIQPGITVVGMASDGVEAVERAIALDPDVVLMDVRMPECDGAQATGRIRRELPGCQVVMLTTFDDEEYVVQALRAGAVGYLLKDLPATELANAVRLARSGIAQFDFQATSRLASALARHPAPVPVTETGDNTGPGKIGQSLTAREVDVLRLIARGATNREIAARLFISEGTVKNHISRILNRIGLRDRTQAAIFARDRGLLLPQRVRWTTTVVTLEVNPAPE